MPVNEIPKPGMQKNAQWLRNIYKNQGNLTNVASHL